MNFDDITKVNNKMYNPNWPNICDHQQSFSQRWIWISKSTGPTEFNKPSNLILITIFYLQ